MSLAEVKTSIAKMSVEERLEIAALIDRGAPSVRRDQVLAVVRLERRAEAELDRRMSEMDAGRKKPLNSLEQIHRELSSRGR